MVSLTTVPETVRKEPRTAALAQTPRQSGRDDSMRPNLFVPGQNGNTRSTPTAGPPPAPASLYYRDKTTAIIDRYGPGPRVHYHIGLFEGDGPDRGTTAGHIRAGISQAQERLLD